MAKERKNRAHPRTYAMTARKSTNWGSVSARTLTGPDSRHSLKAAKTAPMGARSLQAPSALLGASRGLWRVISFPDGLGKNRSGPHSFAHFPEAQKVSPTVSPESIKNQHGKESIKNWRRKERIKNQHGRESIKNWHRELATLNPQKCNDQNTLWQGGSLIRMPY